jgi:hypothetical protein
MLARSSANLFPGRGRMITTQRQHAKLWLIGLAIVVLVVGPTLFQGAPRGAVRTALHQVRWAGNEIQGVRCF